MVGMCNACVSERQCWQKRSLSKNMLKSANKINHKRLEGELRKSWRTKQNGSEEEEEGQRRMVGWQEKVEGCLLV